MAKRVILTEGDDALRRRSRTVERFDARLAMLLDDLADTMYAANGAGLAAPQVGILKRAVVVDAGTGLIELVNPEIVSREGSVIGVESCLSVPGRCCTVERPEKVVVRAQNRLGETIEVAGENFLARALCHEIDHLDGTLYIDRMIEDVSDRYRQVGRDEA